MIHLQLLVRIYYANYFLINLSQKSDFTSNWRSGSKGKIFVSFRMIEQCLVWYFICYLFYCTNKMIEWLKIFVFSCGHFVGVTLSSFIPLCPRSFHQTPNRERKSTIKQELIYLIARHTRKQLNTLYIILSCN